MLLFLNNFAVALVDDFVVLIFLSMKVQQGCFKCPMTFELMIVCFCVGSVVRQPWLFLWLKVFFLPPSCWNWKSNHSQRWIISTQKRKTANSDVVFWWYGAVDFSFFKRDAPHCSKMKPQRGNLRHRRSDGVKKPKASDYQTWSLLCVSQYFVQKGSLEPKRPKQVLDVLAAAADCLWTANHSG